MRKHTIQYTSPLDALVTVTKRLSLYEHQQHMDSETFFDQYSRGQLSDDIVFVDGPMITATTLHCARSQNKGYTMLHEALAQYLARVEQVVQEAMVAQA